MDIGDDLVSRTAKILVTGYAPLPGKLNASCALIQSMMDTLPAALTPHRDRLQFMIMPLDTEAVLAALRDALAADSPRYCVFTGQALGRNRIQWERVAINLRDFNEADAAGHQPRAQPIHEDGPVGYWSTLPGQAATIDALNHAGIPASFSNHAGNHLCNQILYQSLHYAAISRAPLACGFLHIPALPAQAQAVDTVMPFMPLEMTRQALTIVLRTLLEQDTP